MFVTVTTVVVFIALLIALSATYNAYILRGGKLAWSQVFMVLGMLALVLSQIVVQLDLDSKILADISVSSTLTILGFLLLLLSSFKLRHAFK